jgi:hypothetical protein
MQEIIQASEAYRPYVPERGLLAAILERSVRDLGMSAEIRKEDRRAAIGWFRTRFKSEDTYVKPSSYLHGGITYQDCVVGLELSAAQVELIRRWVNAAEET